MGLAIQLRAVGHALHCSPQAAGSGVALAAAMQLLWHTTVPARLRGLRASCATGCVLALSLSTLDLKLALASCVSSRQLTSRSQMCLGYPANSCKGLAVRGGAPASESWVRPDWKALSVSSWLKCPGGVSKQRCKAQTALGSWDSVERTAHKGQDPHARLAALEHRSLSTVGRPFTV